MSETIIDPRIIIAKHPVSPGSTIALAVHPVTTAMLRDDGLHNLTGQLVGLIRTRGILENPLFIFQGLNRPYMSEAADAGIFAYVCKPYWTYVFRPKDRFSGAGPEQLLAPKCSVFVTFVNLDPTMVSAAQSQFTSGTPSIGGVVTAWEWTKATDAEPNLPENHAARYRRRVWPPT